MRELHDNNEDLTPLFEAIVKHVPAPPFSPEPYFQMLVSNLFITAIIWAALHSGES
jgi:GTP-binding protein